MGVGPTLHRQGVVRNSLPDADDHDGLPRADVIRTLPTWAAPPTDLPTDHVFEYWAIAAGWPLPAVSGAEVFYVPSRGWDVKSKPYAVFVGAVDGPHRSNAPSLLPLRPVFPGFAVDALVYVVLLASIGSLCGAKQRRRRARRTARLCVRCGFDLRENTQPGCQECGFGRSRPPGAAHPAPVRPTRVAGALLLALGLGAASVVALSWGGAMVGPFGVGTTMALDPDSLAWSATTMRSATVRAVAIRSGAVDPRSGAGSTARPDPAWIASVTPTWATPAQLSDAAQILYVGAGWPWVAMKCTRLVVSIPAGWSNAYTHKYATRGVTWRQGPAHPFAAEDVIPLTPYWPGLAADAAVFTGAWLALFIIAPRCRRLVRRLRGVCPRCAGFLRPEFDGACGDCGWRPPARGAHSPEPPASAGAGAA